MPVPYMIGVFTGNADATAQSTQQAFGKLIGAPPTCFDAFVNFTDVPNNYLSNTQWFASVCKSAPGYEPPNVPLIHLPTFSTSPNAPSAGQILENYANGTYDSMVSGFVAAWAGAGYTVQDYRVGVEMNLSDGSYTYAGVQPQWIAAFKHISATLKAAFAAHGVTGRVIWNPGCAGQQMSGDIRTTMWNGSAKDMGVDLIGGDCYDAWVQYASDGAALIASVNGLDWRTATYPTKLESFYDTLEDNSGQAFTLPVMIAFAKEMGVGICIPEVGAGSGPSDNPWFVRWLRHKLDSAVADGVPVAFLCIWDSGADVSDLFTDGSKPQEAAAWAYYFGVNAAAPPALGGGAVTPTPTPTPTPAPSGVKHAASPVGTQLPPIPPTIWDSAGTAWTLPTVGGQIYRNGEVVASSANVDLLVLTASGLVQMNSAGQWWTQPADGSAGTSTTAPAGY